MASWRKSIAKLVAKYQNKMKSQVAMDMSNLVVLSR